MLVAIEGMDGSGKSSISKEVAKRVNYKYVDKILKDIYLIPEETFDNLCEQVNKSNNETFKAMFYGFQNLLVTLLKGNIIIDKHVLATYFWNGYDENEQLFNIFVNNGVIPDLTIILYSSIETRIKHIKLRDKNDKDLFDDKKTSFGYDKMLDFAEKCSMPYIFINGDPLSFEQIISQIVELIKVCELLNKEEFLKYCMQRNIIVFQRDEELSKKCLGRGINNEERKR
ncbi:MAG: AAA family ATPase [Bacilli bacterium]|nr:AAA family ATPase [Bacilli bacterium]